MRLKRTVEDIIEIGRELTAVKEELPHGQFLPWIAAEFEMSRETADNFISVHKRFGDKLVNFTSFKPSILYALAAPSTPDSVIEKAIEKAESGAKVTVADVKDWKAELDAERQARARTGEPLPPNPLNSPRSAHCAIDAVAIGWRIACFPGKASFPLLRRSQRPDSGHFFGAGHPMDNGKTGLPQAAVFQSL